MKFGIFGDIHFTNRGPSRRLDNFFETQMSKFTQAFSIFKKHNVQFVFQPGDFFDSHTVADRVKAEIIRFLRETLWYKEGILFVSGQHDIFGHSLHTLPNSPIAVLQAAGVGTLLDSKPTEIDYLDYENKLEKPVQVYGASYGEPIPKVENKEAYNILVIHKMIGDRELYPQQELIKPNQLLRNNPGYQLVICGDYHYQFSSQYQGRTIVNAGCLIRKTISKWDLEHKPSIAIFDTNTNEVTFVELEVKPVNEVFDLHIEDKADRMQTEKFIQSLEEVLSKKGSSGPGWKKILSKIIEEKQCSIRVREVIDECLEEVQR